MEAGVSFESSLNQVALESYAPYFDSATITLTGTGTTNITNVTETGQLLWVAIQETTGPAGNVLATLEISVDGNSTQSLTIYNTGTTLYSGGLLAFGNMNNGGGNLDGAVIPFGFRYGSSIRVGINVKTTAAGSGSITVIVCRAKKLS
jgi:hypothetical protein